MTLPGLAVAVMLIAGPGSLENGAPAACTCVRTLAGSENAREVLCDGYDQQTHETCTCDKVAVGGQIACEPHTPKEGSSSGAPISREPRRLGS